jgi:hypothetical protein
VAEVNEKTQTEERLPGVIRELGELGTGAVITEEGMAHLFDRCERSVQRAIERGELPPPTRLFGKKTWMVGTILEHIKGRLQAEAHERDRMAAKIRTLSP